MPEDSETREVKTGLAPPSVSVVVPVRDGARTLEECLSALCASEGLDEIEVIVVDDGSRDDSADIARRLSCRVERLDPGRGPAAARNHGARSARGPRLAFVDADVRVAPDTLCRLVSALDTVPIAFATYADEPAHDTLATRLYHALSLKSLRETDERTPVAYSYCLAVDRTLFLEVGGFDARLTRAGFEDAELGWRLARRGILAAHLRETTVVHAVRYDPGGLLRAYFRKSRDLAYLLLRERRLSFGNQGWTRRGNWITWAAAWGVLALFVPALLRPWPWAAVWAVALVAFLVRSAVVLEALPRPRDMIPGIALYLLAHVAATAGMAAGALDRLLDLFRTRHGCASPT